MILLESLLALGASGGTVSLLPPRDAHIHISDTLDASGAFVLTHYVLTALQQPAHSVVWVSCHADGFAHWNSIARKALQYIDADAHLESNETLSSLLDDIRMGITVAQSTTNAHEPSPAYLARTLVVVDSLSFLQWSLPGSVEEVHASLVHFYRSLRALCRTHADACSAVSANGSLDAGDEKLFRLLLRSADLWVAVNELASGRAADCDGELTVHALGRTAAAALAPASRDELIPLDAFRLDRPSQACLFRIVPDGTGPKNAYGVRSSVKIWSRGSGQGLA